MKILSSAKIPTHCSSNHAANLLELDSGDLLCTWFGGSMEGADDISVYLSRFDQKERRWGETEKISQDPTRSEQNPVLFQLNEKEIWIYYTAQLKTDQGTSVVRIRKSMDQGKTWTRETDLFADQGTFVRQTPVINPDGRILLPVFHSNIKEAFGNDSSSVYISSDGGKTWKIQEVPESNGCVHMNIQSNCRVAFYRRRRADNIFRSISDDGGISWSPPEPTTLPNNNSSIQGRMLSDGRIAIVFNDRGATGEACESSVPPWVQDKKDFLNKCEITERSAIWGVPRNPLVLAVSDDLGRSWNKDLIIESNELLRSDHDVEGAFIGDYSYPSIVQTKDGNLQICYSYLRDYIKHVTVAM